MGIHTIQIFEINELENLRTEFLEECKKFPEFEKNENYKFVLGGFGALGNPSSFHNNFVRKIRIIVYEKTKDFLKEMYKDKKIEAFFDRMLLRKAGDSPSREKWHRDITPQLEKNDIVYGGWLNLDDKSNFFSCIPGSHQKENDTSGFVKIKKEDYIKLNSKKEKIEILPGHIILFNQNIIHEITATKLKYDSYRIFHGFRITDSIFPIFNYNKVIENQGVPLLPSGQEPPMYAKLHWTNHIQKLVDFSQNLKLKCKEEKFMKTKNTNFLISQRYLKSLKEYNFDLYPEYREEEKKIFYPQKL